MSLVSQDSSREQKYEFVEKSGSGKLGSKNNALKGTPVLFTTQVIDDTKNQRFAENRTLCIEKKNVVVQSSILPIHRYDTQNHAQISSDISIDMNNGIDTSIDTIETSIPENGQNRAQNVTGIDSP
jgi:hypothetical protein